MAPTTQVGHGSTAMSVNPVAADERSRPRLRPAPGVRKLPSGTEIKSAKRLGDWILEEQIGSGSYGVVWSAYHAMYPNQKVAVKIVDLRLLKKPSEREALKREVVLHSKLDHKNIVGLYEIWESDYEIGFVLELVEGGSLFDFLTGPESNDHALHPLARRFKVHRDETRVQVLFWQMLNALDYLHCNWIVHRDVKLENFLVSKDCTTVKLCDFGLSSTFSPDSLMRSTCGSPLYIPPEVLMGVAYDPTKADLWSLGITLFAIIFRKMPFLDNRNQLVLEYCLRGAKNLPPALAKRITPQAHEVLCMLLTPDPAERATLETLFAHPWVQAGKELYEQEQMELHPPLPILSGKVSVAPPSAAANPPVPSFKLQRRRKSFLFLKPYFPSAAAAPATATDPHPAVAAAPAPGATSPVGATPQHQQAAYATGVANQDAAPLTPRGEKLAEELEAMKPSFFSRMLFKPRRKNSI